MTTTFQDLSLPEAILKVLTEQGYETPTPIQAEAIPEFLKGNSILAQSKTGSGKTASFALPILSQLDLSEKRVQALILAPTRELALQVAESFKTYSKYLKGVKVLPIYGGQSFRDQLHHLKDGVHIVVGTPGRVMDHMDRGTLVLDQLKTLVLDEADEMLNMGFIDDIKWILEQIPASQDIQKALFSATIPPTIARLVKEYMGEVLKIQVTPTVNQAETIKQFFSVMPESYKLEALSRFLETKIFDAAIVFTATKTATVEVADALNARGYSVAAINGDMTQEDREKIIKRLKSGSVNIVVATDVAARGLDVDRIGLVINFDIPFNPDSYVHRIGRTGRAGREGEALLFVTPQQRHLLRMLERVTQKTINELKVPTAQQVNDSRFKNFSTTVQNVLQKQDLATYRTQINTLLQETDYSDLDIAAALAFLAQKDTIPLNPNNDLVMSFGEFESRPANKRPFSRPRKGNGPRSFDHQKDERSTPNWSKKGKESKDGKERHFKFDETKKFADRKKKGDKLAPAFPIKSREYKEPSERGARSERPARTERAGKPLGKEKKSSFSLSQRKPAR